MSRLGFDSNSVDAWVDYIQTLHAREIELSLERVRSVFQVMAPKGLPFKILSVAGTNGKGSTSELLASIYRESGHRVGKFTSPHLVLFNERFNVDGVDVDDQELLLAFRAVELARNEIAITYFEYGLLLAIAIFLRKDIDVAVMEVGLGGRLDAVNILDADVAIITSIGLDHTAWLGDTLEQIAYEKAGIARCGKPCIIGVAEPQTSMLKHLQDIRAEPLIIGRDFDVNAENELTWTYLADSDIKCIPMPFKQTGVQLSNAALAVTAIKNLSRCLPVSDDQIRNGIEKAQLLGRCQLINLPNPGSKMVLDVSHNEASMIRLAEFVKNMNVNGRVIAVCGMLEDKEIAVCLSTLYPMVAKWHLASIRNTERGASSAHLLALLQAACPQIKTEDTQTYDSIEQAWLSARKTLTTDDCLVVFGSFFVASDIITLLNHEGVNLTA